MRVRRLLLLLALSVSLAGLVIWICLQRESMALTPSLPAKTTSDTVSATELSRVSEKDSESRGEVALSQGVDGHLTQKHVPQKQIDRAPAKRFLPAESQLVANGQLNQNAVQVAMRSPQFDDFVRKMRDEMASDARSRDVGELYIDAIRNNLLQTPELRMNEFACGITICAGSIEASSESPSWSQWTKNFDDDASAPTYVFAELPFDRGDGIIEHRFVFSTDPESNALTGSF